MLRHLQPGAGNGGLGLGNLGGHAGEVGEHLGARTLDLVGAAARDEALGGELAVAEGLVADDGELLFAQLDDVVEFAQLRLQAQQLLLVDALLVAKLAAPRLEQFDLQRLGLDHAGVVAERLQFAAPVDAGGALALGLQARLVGQGVDVVDLGTREVGLGGEGIDLEQHVALLDGVALAHAQLGNDAAGRVLHGFAVAHDDDRACHADAGVQRREQGPAHEQDEAEHDDDGQGAFALGFFNADRLDAVALQLVGVVGVEGVEPAREPASARDAFAVHAGTASASCWRAAVSMSATVP